MSAMEKFKRDVSYLPSDVVMHIQSFLSVKSAAHEYTVNHRWNLSPYHYIDNEYYKLGMFVETLEDMKRELRRNYQEKGYLIDAKRMELYKQISLEEDQIIGRFGVSSLTMVGDKFIMLDDVNNHYLSISPGVWHYVNVHCACGTYPIWENRTWEYHINGFDDKSHLIGSNNCEACQNTWLKFKNLTEWLHKRAWDAPWGKDLRDWFLKSRCTPHVAQRMVNLPLIDKTALNASASTVEPNKVGFLSITYYMKNHHFDETANHIYYADIGMDDVLEEAFQGLELSNEDIDFGSSIRIIDKNEVIEKSSFLKMSSRPSLVALLQRR